MISSSSPQPMCGFAGVTKTTLVISSSTPTLMISSSSPQPMCGFAKVTNLATASQPLHRLQFCRHNSPVPSSPMRTLTPVCTPPLPVHWRRWGWHNGTKQGQSAARIITRADRRRQTRITGGLRVMRADRRRWQHIFMLSITPHGKL